MAPRRRTIVLASAAVLLGLLVLAVGAVATLTQTDRGRALVVQALLPVLRNAIPGRLYIGRVSGSLFTDITIDSLELREPSGAPFISTGRIRAEYDPRDLLDRRIVLKRLEVTRPIVSITDYGKDDWNYKRVLQRPRRGPNLPKRPGSFGQYVVIDSTTVHEGTLVVRQPWTLSDTLKSAKRDSALAFNLTRLDGEIRRSGNRLQRVWRFVRGEAAFGRMRLAHPDSAGQKFEVRKFDVVWVYPPFWFRNMSNTVTRLGDSIWVDNSQFSLAQSHATGKAKIVWGGGLPVRYDIQLHADSVAMTDMAWIDETLPRSGGGTTDIRIRNDPRNLSVIEYVLRNMDARSLQSRVRGNMTFGVGGPVLRVTDVALDMQPANMALLRQFNGEPFPFDWQGNLTGRLVARGGPVNRFQIDQATFAYADAHVPGAVSSGAARGTVDIYAPAETILRGVDLRIDQLDLRTPRYVNPLFPEINGIVRGTVRLDSLWYDARFSLADIEHADGPGEPSRFTGSGRYTLVTEGVKFDVDLQASPLSYTTLSRSYPSLPLRGNAVGSIRASGMADDFSLATILAGEGGEIMYEGRVDALEPEYAARGAFRTRSVNLQTLFGESTYPSTTLSLAGTMDVSGSALTTMRGPRRATVDQFSRVADVRLFGGTVAVTFDSGALRVDTASIESSAFRLNARGGVGLTAARRDSLRFTAVADSLGGLRPWMERTGLIVPQADAEPDSLRGLLELRGSLAGSVDSLDPLGLSLSIRADGRELVLANSRSARLTASLELAQLRRGGTGSLVLTLDSALIAGLDIASVAGRSTVRDGVAERFGVEARTLSESRLAVAGGMVRNGVASTVTLDTINIRVDSASSRPRGFSLLAPSVFHLAGDSVSSTGTLDSLVLVHTDTGRFALRGSLADSGNVTGRLDADRLPLADLTRLLGLTRFAGGTASAQATLSGTRVGPRIAGTVAVRDASVGRVRVAGLDAKAEYDSLRLRVDGALTVEGRPALQATASLPLDLALMAGRTRRIDEPLTGRIVSDRTDLSLLEALFPDVTRTQGSLSTDVALTGTWGTPRLRGAISMQDAGMSLGNLGIRIEGAVADIALAGDSVHVRRFRARSGGPNDTVGVSGVMTFTDASNPVFDLRLASNNFLAIDKARTASLSLTTTTPITLVGPQSGARVRGSLLVDRGRVYINALTQRRGLDLEESFSVIDTATLGMNALLPKPPNALVQNLVLDNLTVNVGDDVWLRSPEANLKMGGSLRVTRSVSRDDGGSRLAFSDSLTVERGTYQLNLGIARPSFDVERGVVRFFGDPDLEPALDITALHTVRETRPNSNRQNVRVRVSIGGNVDRPTLALSSADNPPLPESDLLSYLVTGEPAQALLGSNSAADQGATLALRLASSYLSSRLAGGRFDVVQVEPTSLSPGEAANLRTNGLGILASTRLGVGFQVARNTYLSLSGGLCGLSQQTSASGDDALDTFRKGLGVRVERRFANSLSVSLGLEPASSAESCGRTGTSRAFRQTPSQIGIDFFRSWTF
ncbi:MAG TPA: translocation/assembly module TamB domain-containing protein [Gemmatimonas sp.]|nr:translocation/assembly module TamB domain-containing protein [Gemmatimonas sp.]